MAETYKAQDAANHAASKAAQASEQADAEIVGPALAAAADQAEAVTKWVRAQPLAAVAAAACVGYLLARFSR